MVALLYRSPSFKSSLVMAREEARLCAWKRRLDLKT